MADLTLDQMKEVLANGGSVLLHEADGGRRLATKVEHLPTEADLAKGDPAKERAAAEALDAQIAALQQARAGLGKAPVAPAAPAPSPDLRAEAAPAKAPEKAK